MPAINNAMSSSDEDIFDSDDEGQPHENSDLEDGLGSSSSRCRYAQHTPSRKSQSRDSAGILRSLVSTFIWHHDQSLRHLANDGEYLNVSGQSRLATADQPNHDSPPAYEAVSPKRADSYNNATFTIILVLLGIIVVGTLLGVRDS